MLKNFRTLALGALASAMFLAAPAKAALSPLSLAVIPPVQLPPSDFAVTGARLSVLWGQHRSVHGIDLGVIGNTTTQGFGGIGISGLFNYNGGPVTIVGLQAAGITNFNKNKVRGVGLQAALGLNYNQGESSFGGLQLALANLSSHTKIYGVQVGAYNRAKEVFGFQIGLINVATDLHGIQIGLLNFHTRGLFAVAPILNVGF